MKDDSLTARGSTMSRLFASLILMCVIFVDYCSVARAADQSNSWWIEISPRWGETYRVRMDGSGWSKAAQTTHWGELSPDGKHVVYGDSVGSGWEIFIADADGKKAQQLTRQNGYSSPSWMPDGKRIVFDSERSGRSQVYAMKADGTNVEQLTNDAEGAALPKATPDGRLAYLRVLEKEDKLPKKELVVREGRTSRAIIKDVRSDYSWSPDGKTIAYGQIGRLLFHDVDTAKEREINFPKDIHADMDHYTADQLTWRPDGQVVACSIVFAGGREAGDKMFGDEEIFIIPRDGRPTWIATKLKGEGQYLPTVSLKWVRQE
jgi:dipeptidyl aminopeptidase/acylaminoacyl peptidase